ncbi:alpha-(1,3)-fucosyltransferase C-like [Penaeus chinensis]|uniref:alpha-(1,3)-fucosyltransferase C-like n=1 Tax=Penaeus chinensis TaxID=139456 RepID=UPI001FB6B50E|nr:alpha-(1,3)-fucosyltransferase C-like [Penaeus chinensis]
MSGLQQQQSSPKIPVLLLVVVVTGVSFYRTLDTQLNRQATLQFRNPRPGVQEKPTEGLKGPSEALQRPSEAQKTPSEGVGEEEEATLEDQMEMKPKVVLFWTSWFGSQWAAKKGVLTRFGTNSMEELREDGCAETNCFFTTDKAMLPLADALLFVSQNFHQGNFPKTRKPWQRWVWTEVEAPLTGSTLARLSASNLSHYINWTMTYHERADVVAFYGYFRSLNTTLQPVRPNLIENHRAALAKYRDALARNTTLEQVMGPSWRSYVRRSKIVAWMSGHCPTISRREEYVRELAKHIPVDMYGTCGSQVCKTRHPLKPDCWVEVLKDYHFYMAMENNLCDQYITEKLYNPLKYNLVPVVWGGSNYSRFLPPNSFIDARKYHPKELAALLLKLTQDPVAYGKYHVWRGFWEPRVGGSLCELCHRLHTDTQIKHHVNIPNERRTNGLCIRVKKNLFGPDSAWKEVIYNNHKESTGTL